MSSLIPSLASQDDKSAPTVPQFQRELLGNLPSACPVDLFVARLPLFYQGKLSTPHFLVFFFYNTKYWAAILKTVASPGSA